MYIERMNRLKGKDAQIDQDHQTYIHRRQFKGWFDVAKEHMGKPGLEQVTVMKNELDRKHAEERRQ